MAAKESEIEEIGKKPKDSEDKFAEAKNKVASITIKHAEEIPRIITKVEKQERIANNVNKHLELHRQKRSFD